MSSRMSPQRKGSRPRDRRGSRRRDRRERRHRRARVVGGDHRDRVAGLVPPAQPRLAAPRRCPPRSATSTTVARRPRPRPCPATTTTTAPRRRARRRPRRPEAERPTCAATFEAGARVPARPVPAARARRARRRASRCSSPRRPGRARRSSPSTRSRARSPTGGEGLLHDAAEGAVEPEVRRLRARLRRATRVGLLTGDNVDQRRRADRGDDHRGAAQHDLRARRPRSTACATSCSTRCTTSRTATAGAVWEEVIIHLPARDRPSSRLSATVSNAEEVAAWMQTVRGETEAVIEERRPVELEHLYLVGERGAEQLHLLPTFVDGRRRAPPQSRSPPASTAAERPRPPGAAGAAGCYKPWRTEVVERLAEERMLPAIVFVFSPRRLRPGGRAVPRRRACASPTPAERRALRRDRRRARRRASPTTTSTCSATTRGSPASKPASPRTTPGMVPPMKEAVEEAFAAGPAEGRVRDRDARRSASTCRRARS